jgi:hypothetical protein
MPLKSKQKLEDEYFDFMLKSLRTMLKDLKAYNATFKKLNLSMSSPQNLEVLSVRDKFPREPLGSKTLLNEIFGLRNQIDEVVTIASSIERYQDSYITEVRKKFRDEETEKVSLIAAEIWDIKKYQPLADAMRVHLTTALKEFFEKGKKKSPAIYQKYAALYLPNSADMASVVAAINEILKNPSKYDPEFVEDITFAVEEKFKRAPGFIGSPFELLANQVSHKPQIVFDVRAASSKIYEKFINKLTNNIDGMTYELTHASVEMEQSFLLKDFRKKISDFFQMRRAEIALDNQISKWDEELVRIRAAIHEFDIRDVIFLHHVEELEKQLTIVKNPQTTQKQAEAIFIKLENRNLPTIQNVLKVFEVEFTARHDLYQDIVGMLNTTPALKNNLGNMLTYVNHAPHRSTQWKTDITNLKQLVEIAKENLAPSPKGSSLNFFPRPGQKPLTNLVAAFVQSFLQIISRLKNVENMKEVVKVQKSLEAFKPSAEQLIEKTEPKTASPKTRPKR